MTSSSNHVAVPVQPGAATVEYDQAYADRLVKHAVDAVMAQVTQVSASGVKSGHVAASDVAAMGAILGAAGYEKAAVTALLQELQTVTIQVFMQQLPNLLEKLRVLQRSRINKAMQAIAAMPTVTATAGGGLFNRGPVSTHSYISREEVLRVLSVIMEETPST